MSEVPGNVSDDDVIEVVRDEAPIEILSDGEELELEKIRQAQSNMIQDFHFTSPPTETNTEVEGNRGEEDHIIDPLTNTETITNDIQNCHILTPIDNIVTVHSTTDTVNEENTNHDDNDENQYVNVTDDVNMDEPSQSDHNKTEQNDTTVDNNDQFIDVLNDVPGDKASEIVNENK